MQTSKVDKSVNFGKLYMPYRRDIIGRTDIYYANIVDIVRPKLEELAKDIDIYVKPNNFKEPGFNIKISKITESPIKRFFGILGETVNKKIFINYIDSTRIADFLLENVIESKKEFKIYEAYLTKS